MILYIYNPVASLCLCQKYACKSEMVNLSRRHLLTIVVVSFTIASILITLPARYDEEEENRRGGTTTTTRTSKPTLVPTVIFDTLPPSTFQAFVIALVFAFASSLSALLIHDAENQTGEKGRISRLVTRLFGCVSLASITFALAILSWALLLTAASCWSPSISQSLLALPKSCAVAFFSMTFMFVPDRLAWAVWAAAGVLALVLAYSLAERL